METLQENFKTQLQEVLKEVAAQEEETKRLKEQLNISEER